ncbi:MAG: Ascorbate-specific phosphotransferase enzyme component [Actinomycetota bacterium]
MPISAQLLPLEMIRVDVFAEHYAQAISAAGDLLVAAGITKPAYTDSMIRVVEELGPYIVLVEGVALAHAAPGEEVTVNGLSVVSLTHPVDFGNGKVARLVIALAALNHDAHIETLGALAEILGEAETLAALLNSQTAEEIHALLTATSGE